MAKSQNSTPSLNIEVRDDVDYRYRDVFQALVGQGEVVLEFGNVNRAEPSRITIADRIVVSLPTAVRLTQHLNEQLHRAQDRMKSQRNGNEKEVEAAAT